MSKKIVEVALNFAIKFFVEEALIRSQGEIDKEEILKKIGITI